MLKVFRCFLLLLLCFTQGPVTAQNTNYAEILNDSAFTVSYNDLDQAIQISKKALAWSQDKNDHKGVVASLDYISVFYNEKGNNDLAMSYLIDALEYSEKNLPEEPVYRLKEQLAILFYTNGNKDKAISYFDEVVREVEAEGTLAEKQSTYTNYAIISSNLNQLDKAGKYFHKAISIENEDSIVTAQIWNNYGNYFSTIGDLDSASICYHISLDYISDSTHKFNANIYNGLTDIAIKKASWKKAEQLALKAIYIAQNKANINSEIYALKNLIEIQKNKNNFKKAFDYQSMLVQAEDSLDKLTNDQILNELEQKYQNEKKAGEIEKLKSDKAIINEKRQKDRLKNWLLIALISGVSVLLLLFLFFKNKQHKKNIALKEQEQKIQQLELRKKEQELERYKSELKEHTQHLLEKNQILNELRDELKKEKSRENSVEPEKAKELQQLINSKILTDDDWLKYRKTFLNVYPRFFIRLNEVCPNISKSEQRLAALLKLGLSQNEMATILGISAPSVRKTRYRLRQKLDFDKDDQLKSMLHSLN